MKKRMTLFLKYTIMNEKKGGGRHTGFCPTDGQSFEKEDIEHGKYFKTFWRYHVGKYQRFAG